MPPPLSVEYFGNLGTSEALEVTFIPVVPASGSSNQWTMQIRDSAGGGTLIGEYDLTFDNTRGAGGALASVSVTRAAPTTRRTARLHLPSLGGRSWGSAAWATLTA